jgi:hypothetical protein
MASRCPLPVEAVAREGVSRCESCVVVGEGAGEFAVGIDLRQECLRLVLNGVHGIGPGDPSGGRLVGVDHGDESDGELGGVTALFAVHALPRLSELVGELAMRSEEFRTRWASHNVRFHNTGTKHFMHPLVGELTLNFERFDLAAEHGLKMFTYTAEPRTRSAEGLDLLASWTATPHAPEINQSHLEPGAK